MKRILVLISIVFACNSAFAQQVGTSKSINFNALEKKVAKSNADIENPKKNIKDATWISRAELMLEVYNSQFLNAYNGMTPDNFNIVVGKPDDQSNDDIDGVSTDKYIFDRVTFFFVEGKLLYWNINKPIVENPLEIAFESIKKGIELDVKGKKAKKITEILEALGRHYVDNGLNYYYSKNYIEACKNFQNNITVTSMPQINKVDTAIYYYAALSAQLGKDYETAIALYPNALNYENGTAYSYIYDAYKQLGRADEGIKYLESGFLKFPANSDILFSMINYYIERNEDPSKILIYIDKALVDNPQNESLLFAKGSLFDKLEKFDEAIEAYKQAIEIKPDFFNAYYNLGAVYYNLGVKLVEEANKIPVSKQKEYDELIEKSAAEFKKSIPYMVKAAEIDPESKEATEAVVNLYFRFRNESDEMMNLWKQYKEKLDALK